MSAIAFLFLQTAGNASARSGRVEVHLVRARCCKDVFFYGCGFVRMCVAARAVGRGHSIFTCNSKTIEISWNLPEL
jgi:hypothetical protein